MEPAVDLGVCLSWRDFRPLFGPVNDVFYLKLHWTEVHSCSIACEIIQLFSVDFCVVTTVREFEFRIVIKKTASYSDSDSVLKSSADCRHECYRNCPQAVHVNCIPLSKGGVSECHTVYETCPCCMLQCDGRRIC